VIGFGYWGPKLARNLAAIPGCRIACICDVDPERLSASRRAYPGVECASSPDDVLSDPGIDGVVVAAPASTHYPLALAALLAGKHVFVEKPLARSAAEARHLVEVAESRGLTLMVGHVFIYAGAVRRARELLRSERFGELRYYDSTRLNSEPYPLDVGALWDLAVHDLSILDYLAAERPRAVSATGVSHRGDGLETTAYLTLFYDSGLIGHIAVHSLAPEKVRRALLGGTGQMIVYDELEPIEKLRVFDHGLGPNGRVPFGANDNGAAPWAPDLDRTEALLREMEDFVEAVASGRPPEADGAAGVRVVEVLEAADRSIRERGRPVELGADG
jgi:predicted dehydrogenase